MRLVCENPMRIVSASNKPRTIAIINSTREKPRDVPMSQCRQHACRQAHACSFIRVRKTTPAACSDHRRPRPWRGRTRRSRACTFRRRLRANALTRVLQRCISPTVRGSARLRARHRRSGRDRMRLVRWATVCLIATRGMSTDFLSYIMPTPKVPINDAPKSG